VTGAARTGRRPRARWYSRRSRTARKIAARAVALLALAVGLRLLGGAGDPLDATRPATPAARGVPAEIKPRKFPRDTIEIKDAFLQTKVPELLPQRRPATRSPTAS
jgi:hypothetical protein